MEELFWGPGGGAPSRQKPLEGLANFKANLIKIMVLKSGVEIDSANMIKLVA